MPTEEEIKRRIERAVKRERGRCYAIARKYSSRLLKDKLSCLPCEIAREIIKGETEIKENEI